MLLDKAEYDIKKYNADQGDGCLPKPKAEKCFPTKGKNETDKTFLIHKMQIYIISHVHE